MSSAAAVFETITVEKDGAVGVVTLNRPNVLNALNAQLLGELSSALVELERDHGQSARSSSPARVKKLSQRAPTSASLTLSKTLIAGADQARIGQSITRQIERLRKPVIMAVNGFALGGGCEIAMSGDIRIASENAKFGQPEVNLGLIPGYGGSQRTTRLVGKGMAMYLCLTGEIIDAAEALRIGLVEKVVPLADLLTEAKRIGNLIATKAPLAITACKRAINNGAHLSIDDALELEAIEFGTLVDTEDFTEGTSAFLQKRKPAWKAQ